MDDVVAGREGRRQGRGFGVAAAVGAPGLLAKAEELQIGEEKELRFGRGPAAVEIGGADLERARRQAAGGAVGGSRRRSRRGKMSCSSKSSVRRSTWSVAMATRQPSARRSRTASTASARRPAKLGAARPALRRPA